MKRKLIANKDFTSKDGKNHKAGERVELDEQEAQDVIQRGEAKDDPQAQQQSR